MVVKVYAYGANRPCEGLQLHEDSVQRGHRYYNKLIELHRARLTHTQELRARHVPGLDAAEAGVPAAEEHLRVLLGQVKARNAAARRKRATAEDQAFVKEARAAVKRARDLRKQLRGRCSGAGLAELAAALLPRHDSPGVRALYDAATAAARALSAGRKPNEIDQAALAAAWDQFGAAAAAADPAWAEFAAYAAAAVAYQRGLAAVWAEFRTANKVSYNASPCWWGTKLKMEEAAERAAEDAVKHGGLPGFRRWKQVRFLATPPPVETAPGVFIGAGDGLSATQLQGGLSAEELLACTDTRLRLDLGVDQGKRVSPRAARKVVFWLRLGSTPDGKPAWTKVPAYYHRGGELPPDAKIKWAVLVQRAGTPRRQSDGSWRPYYRYAVQLTVQTAVTRPCADSRVCGLNIGWRSLEDGSLRVAVAVGTDGAVTELRLPPDLMRSWDYFEELQGRRDDYFNGAVAVLTAWLAGTAAAPPALEDVLALWQQDNQPAASMAAWRRWGRDWARPELPAWLAAEVQHLHLWKSHRRLARLLDLWVAHGYAGGEAALAALTCWREREAHLEKTETTRRAKVERRRLDLYRKFAAALARRYRTVAVEDTNYRELLRRLPAESNDNDAAGRTHARHAAPGTLRQCLENRAGHFLPIPAWNISRIHEPCGRPNDQDRKPDIMLWCPVCKVDYDQDENAARNVLARALVDLAERAGPAAPENGEGNDDGNGEGNGAEPAATEGGGRWAKRRQARAKKAEGRPCASG